MKRIQTLALLVLAFGVALSAGAAPVSSTTATSVVRHWLDSEKVPLGAKLGNQVDRVETFNGSTGSPLYHVVYLKPSGFVIVAGEDVAEPIIAFAAHGHFDPSASNPLGALVARDLPQRIAAAQQHPTAASVLKSHAKWQRLQQAFGSTNSVHADGLTQSSITDLRVAPFVASAWNQSTIDDTIAGQACYNFFTPPYEADSPTNAPCGCVATALAQVMYYDRYPTNGVGTNAFTVYFANQAMSRQLRGGDGNGGAYNYADMPADPLSSGATAAQCAAIGDLTSDAGVAVHMQYTLAGSSAYLTDAETALRDTFKFANVILTESSSINVGYDLYNMINADLDARVPVVFGIEDTKGNGHCIVCDGYGYSDYNTLYHHLNLGWGGDDTAWYQLPIIDITDSNPFYIFNACMYNLFPTNTGEIISGRVLDPKGNPLVGATVSGMSSKGGTFTVTTDTHGIYAFVGVPSDSICTIEAVYDGYFPATSNIVTGVSSDESTSCGNMWESDFVMVPAVGAPVFATEPANQAVTVASNATFTASATGQLPLSYQWQYEPSGSTTWVNVNDDSTNSGATTGTLIVGPASLAMSGEPFRCVVTNSLGSSTSAPVLLTVDALPFIFLTTLAGTAGTAGYADAASSGALFNNPQGIAVDGKTNIFVADRNNHVIRKIAPTAAGWAVTTIAGQAGVYGTADGSGTNAQFDGPFGVALDSAGRLFVADTGNSTIRLLTPSGSNWVVSTIAGQAGTRGNNDGVPALFNLPMGLAVDASDNVFVADEGNHDIRKLALTGTNWVAYTIAGSGSYGTADGSNTLAEFGQPYGIAVNSADNVFVADEYNHDIRQLTPSGGSWIVSTIAGKSGAAGSADGFGSVARFKGPTGIAVAADDVLYVADNGNNTIRRLTLLNTNWLVFTTAGVAGTVGSAGGLGAAVEFNSPFGVAVNNTTNIYVTDEGNDIIRGPGVTTIHAPNIVHLAQQSATAGFTVAWNAQVGQAYRVQYKTNLSETTWNDFSTVTASNWTGVVSVPVGSEAQRFYRVIPAQ